MCIRDRSSGRLPRFEAGLATALMLVGALLVWRLQTAPPPAAAPAVSAEDRAQERTREVPGRPTLSMRPNVPAPELRFTTLDGRDEALSDLRGKVVLVNFWATWCGPCLKELPALSDLSDRLGPLGLVVVALSSEPPDTIRAFLRQTPVRTLVGRTTPEALEGVFAGGLDNLPTTFVIDRDGTVVQREVGGRTREEFEAMVADLLAPNLAAR